MARLARLLSGLGVLLLTSASAHAGTLTNATWFQVVEGGFQTTQGIPMTRTLGQLGAAGTSTATSIALSLSYPFLATTPFVPGSLVDLAVQVTQGGPQGITATVGMAGGTPGIAGTVVVMTAVHVAIGANQSMFHVGAQTLVQVPLSHGKAGQFTNTFSISGQLHGMTVDFYAWTLGAVGFSGLSSLGNALPNVTAAGSFNLTAGGGGGVTLVSPSKVSIDGAFAQRRTASFTTLVLTFVPEPGTLLLLGAGALALVLSGRRRR
jgi:hypothetical protein